MLLEAYRGAARVQHEAHDELCRELARLRKEEGFSARGLAAALGVSFSTVQHWTKQGRTLLD